MATEAQKRARDKYNREHKKVITIGFYPKDAELLNHLNAQANKAGYIKSLIQKDLDK